MSSQTNVVVIGGGYAGVMAANRLGAGDDIAVTLINPRPEFVERIRLHQFITGSDDAVVAYDEVLGTHVRLVVDTAESIDAAARTVTIGSGETLGYDYLIYAVGSTGATLDVPGVAEFAYPISEFEHAQPLLHALNGTPADAPVVVVGSGPTGLEVATELAEHGRRVTLVCGGALAPSVAEPARRSIAKRMRKLDVTVIDGPDSLVTEVRTDAVRLADGRDVASAVTVWTVGFAVPDLAQRSGLATDELGRLLTDETLTSVDNPYIVAAGDASAPSNDPLRMSCQAAMPLGAQAAQTVLSRIAGTDPAVVNQAFTGQCISLGRTGGTIQIAHLDDRVTRLYLSGGVAARIKETVCKATVSFLAKEARKPGSYFWLKGGKRAQRLAEVQSVS